MTINTNEINYRKSINTENIYRISHNEFRNWLTLNNYTDIFRETLARIENLNDYETLYFLAWDYSIPVILVKFFYYEIHN